MTHRTVPLDLLVRVRDVLMAYRALRVNPLRIGELETLMDDLTAQIEQQGQGEPVAWQYFDAGQWWPTSSIDKYPPNIPTRALYATTQDSGQGEPVAWKIVPCDPTAAMTDAGATASKYLGLSGAAAVWKYMLAAAPATPQDSVPAWAKELAAKWRYEGLNLECEGWVMLAGRARKCADELESRALALAQTKEPT